MSCQSAISVSTRPISLLMPHGTKSRRKMYLLDHFYATAQPLVLAQVLLVPCLELFDHCCGTELLAGWAKYHPRSGNLLVLCATSTDASNSRV
jgi:hypothetical protein